MNTHPYEWLKVELRDALAEAGFRSGDEQRHPDVFGIAFIVFENELWQLRLIWDGKDGWAVLQRRLNDSGEWMDVAEVLTEGDLEGDTVEIGKIQRWKTAIAELCP